MIKTRIFAAIASAALFNVTAVAAELGKDLTPFGAQTAGNSAGTIPAWSGGLTAPVAGFKPGGHYPDPYAGDKPLFTIDAGNVEQHQGKIAVSSTERQGTEFVIRLPLAREAVQA